MPNIRPTEHGTFALDLEKQGYASKLLKRYRCYTAGLAVLSVGLLAGLVTVILAWSFQSNSENGLKVESMLSSKQQPMTSQDQLWPPSSDARMFVFPNAAVGSDNGLCAEIGRDMLIQGGNAVDGIIATALCQGATISQSSGIGGGMFMTVYNRTTQKCTVVDGREMAGERAFKDMYSYPNASTSYGYTGSGVPGEFAGLRKAWELFGTLPWSAIVQPTIQLCQKGFPTPGSLAEILGNTNNANVQRALYEDDESGLTEILINPATGAPFKTGEIMRRPALGRTLERLASSPDPIKEFYQGQTAKNLVKDIQHGGGILTENDFAVYKVTVYESPMLARIGKEHVICGPPPPSSSAVLAAILKVLTAFDLSKSSLSNAEKAAAYYHRQIEAFKFAYAARSELGDPAFVPAVSKVVDNITSDAWAARMRDAMTDHSQPLSVYNYFGQDPKSQVQEDHGTSHMNAADRFGNAVALTSSVNFFFGSRMRSKSTGIIMNNQMDDFSQPGKSNGFDLPPAPNNFIEPGKRPQSSMIPIVIYNGRTGEVKFVAGGAGGSRIISAVANTVTNMLWFEKSVKDAIDSPRVHNQYLPDHTNYDYNFPQEIVRLLNEEYGQVMQRDFPRETSVVTGIERDNGQWLAATDYRKKGGYPAGF